MEKEKFRILDTWISAINMDDASLFIQDAVDNRKNKYVCVCPVSTVMACKRDKEALESVNQADLATPDGMPVVWFARFLGYRNVRRVYGPDLMRMVCGIAREKGYRNYFYGSSRNVLDNLQEKLARDYPGLAISGSFSPPFRELSREEDGKIVEEINNSGADIVWVGLGSPKQDVWMHKHRQALNAPLLIGVGAAFDFLSGIKRQAPRWMQSSGLEWVFRLASEPKRLWRRYLVDNMLFMYHISADIAKMSPGIFLRKKHV